jgi:ABC-type sugar transport system ATPase subunit
VTSLSLTAIGKSFGDTQVLHDLDLEVPDGTLLTLLGPSGSGKTTLLRLIAGLETVDTGAIAMGERGVTGVPPRDRDISMVFQGFALFPHMTVAQNIGFGLSVRRVPREEAGRRVSEAAALTGCETLLERRPGQLSGGERQRVALARAVVREPSAFLLDEPLSNLDAPVRAGMRAELKRLQRRVGTTMVYVTHDQVEALTLGDLVGVLDLGTIQQVGTPDEVYRRPANRLVASFVGSPGMNVLPARHAGGELTAGPFRLRLPRDAGDLPGEVQLGIRPSAVRLGDGGHDATVELVEVSGDESYVHLGAGEVRLVVTVPTGARPQPGDRVPVTIPPRSAFVFDAASGRTLVYPA